MISMGINEIKGIGPATVKKLDAAGVRTLSDLRSMDTDRIEQRTGIQKRHLDQWRLEARMMKVIDDVKGIGPATKRRLQQAGIHSLEDLARESAHQVAVQARVAKDRAASWQKDAKRLLQQTQGRFVEEREKAVQGGKRFAKQASQAADAAGRTARKATGQGRDRPASGQGETRASGEVVGEAEGEPPHMPGNNGDAGGLLTRLRRFFQPKA